MKYFLLITGFLTLGLSLSAGVHSGQFAPFEIDLAEDVAGLYEEIPGAEIGASQSQDHRASKWMERRAQRKAKRAARRAEGGKARAAVTVGAISLGLGVLGLLFIPFTLLALIGGIIGLIMAIQAKNAGEDPKQVKLALIFSIISIVGALILSGVVLVAVILSFL